MVTNNYYMYIVVAIVLVIASLTFVQNSVAKLLGQTEPTLLTNLGIAAVCFGIYALSKYLIQKYNTNKEPFFFTVSSDQKCKGAFSGKPLFFEFNNHYDGMPCGKDTNQSYGYISTDPDSTKRAPGIVGMGKTKCNDNQQEVCFGSAMYK